jgi:two-component system OmpR family response regulator
MPTVLLVDDSPVAQHVLAGRLRAAGFEVLLESSVEGARRAGTVPCCCAVVDLELPDGDGVALAEALQGTHAALPVAFFTAGAEPALLSRARARGPVFAKPNADAVVAWAKATRRAESQPPPTK